MLRTVVMVLNEIKEKKGVLTLKVIAPFYQIV